MKLCYQVATPDVVRTPLVTAFQGELGTVFAKLADLGYDGVELMVRDPSCLNKAGISKLAAINNLEVAMVCTGEVYGQDHLSFIDLQPEIRKAALVRMKSCIDFAAYFGAQVNIGRLRGQYYPDVPPEVSNRWALDAFKQITEWGEQSEVISALEPINILQSNFINSTQEGMKWVDKVGSPYFRMMLDLFHMHIEDQDLLESFNISKGYYSYVHLADSNRRIPGNCKLNFPAIIKQLYELNYEGWLGVEIFQLPDQEIASSESIGYLNPILRELNTTK